MLVALPALAKGIQGATIDSPSGESIRLTSEGEPGSGRSLVEFGEATGFFQLVFSADVTGEGLGILTEAPTAQLGPEFKITWHIEGSEVEALLYPSADGGALVYMEPGLHIPGLDVTTTGGWFSSPADLETMLREYGADVPESFDVPVALPADMIESTPASEVQAAPPPPVPTPATSPPPAVAIAGLVLLAGLIGIWAMWRRPRRLKAS